MEKQLNPEFQKELIQFFEYHPPVRLSRNLRRVLLDFLRYELRTGAPFYLEHLLWDSYNLFDLLDKAAFYTQSWQDPDEFDPEDLYPVETIKKEPLFETGENNKSGQQQHSGSSELNHTVSEFFTYATLDEVKSDLWEILKSAISNERDEHETRKLSNYMFTYEQLIILLQVLNNYNEKTGNNPSMESATKPS